MKIIPITAILCITILEIMAIWAGIDGAIFGMAIAAIAGLGGYEIKYLRDKRKG